jgi:hypothetical protein
MSRIVRAEIPVGAYVRLPKRMGLARIEGIEKHATKAGSRIYRIRTAHGHITTISETHVALI